MLQNLNNEQRLAVETTEGPLLVLSGAGTGKTRVLTTRIAHILNMRLAQPWQVLALTFTNKAANEMKFRLGEFSNGDWYSGDIWCGTFHSICLRILRANAQRVGLNRDFIIYGEDEQKTVIKSLLSSSTKTPAEYIEEFSSIKDRGLIAYQHKDKLFNAYNAELARLNAVDFGDIILRVLDLFDKNPDVLMRYQNQFKYILVDEFQDTNNAQMEFLTMLTRGLENPNICCVGDDDQSIYSWRGAEIKHILNFDKTFPNAQIIRLETNYRSTSNILQAANSLIRHNQGRLGKDLRAMDSTSMGEPVYVLTLPTDRDEARIIADAILRDGTNEFSKYALLIRAGGLSRIFEEEFASRGIPYRLIGATKFYDRMEIRDVIAYLRLLVYPFDDISFLRVIGKPRRGFGDKAIERLRACGTNLMAGMRHCEFAPKLRAVADEFLSAFDFPWYSMPPKQAAQTLLERTGYMKMWSESKDSDAKERISNINELISTVIAKYETLPEFIEQAALMMTDDNDATDNPANANTVSIMTIHAAKGLEFDTVFLPAWEEAVFPNDKAINEGAIEEERRLAYVAITRARRRCVISNSMMRIVYGSRQYNAPSRFISEMDNRYLDFQGGAAPSYSAHTYNSQPRPQPKDKISRPASMLGKLVVHRELGSGVVIEDSGAILTIAFKKRGIKKVAREYITVVG